MNLDRITTCVELAENFCILARKTEVKAEEQHQAFLELCPDHQLTNATVVWASKESGALRRASMDLTRALAELRK